MGCLSGTDSASLSTHAVLRHSIPEVARGDTSAPLPSASHPQGAHLPRVSARPALPPLSLHVGVSRWPLPDLRDVLAEHRWDSRMPAACPHGRARQTALSSRPEAINPLGPFTERPSLGRASIR